MNKIGLVIVILIIAVIGIFTLGGKKDTNKNSAATPAPTANQTAGDKKIEGTIVAVTDSGFIPKDVTIKTGTKVTWINKAGTVVTVDSAQHPTHLVYPPLNLGQFENGSSVNLLFDKPGKYFYHNHLNPTQFGSVTVE